MTATTVLATQCEFVSRPGCARTGRLVLGDRLLAESVNLSPVLTAGWAGLIVNALNCLPVGAPLLPYISRSPASIDPRSRVLTSVIGMFDAHPLACRCAKTSSFRHPNFKAVPFSRMCPAAVQLWVFSRDALCTSHAGQQMHEFWCMFQIGNVASN